MFQLTSQQVIDLTQAIMWLFSNGRNYPHGSDEYNLQEIMKAEVSAIRNQAMQERDKK